MDFSIKRMIRLRLKGWSYKKIGKEFNKNYTTIIYHCQKLGITPPRKKKALPKVKITSVFKKHKTKTLSKYDYLFEQEENPGKSYKEYLAESLKRITEKKYYDTYYKYYPNPKIKLFEGPSLLAEAEEEERGECYPSDLDMV